MVLTYHLTGFGTMKTDLWESGNIQRTVEIVYRHVDVFRLPYRLEDLSGGHSAGHLSSSSPPEFAPMVSVDETSQQNSEYMSSYVNLTNTYIQL